MNYTDKEIINSALVSLKHLRIMYTYFCEEAGTSELFTTANDLFEEVTQIQRSTYDLMIEQNFMKVKPESSNNIETAYTQLQTIVKEMK